MTQDTGGVPTPRILTREDGATIAYHRTPGRAPGVVFLPGFRSDMTGSKALALEALCRARGQAYLRFDYTGHGASSGDFLDGTIGGWRDDAVGVLDTLTKGPQILVGSSMGGWIMLLVARARPERVAGLVGIAAAPDFAGQAMFAAAPPEMRAALSRDGVYYAPSQYDEEPTPITMRLIEEAEQNHLLKGPIPISCPVRLLHGMADPDVPWRRALVISDKLEADDVEITFVKSGDHRLSEPRDLERLSAVVGNLCDALAGA